MASEAVRVVEEEAGVAVVAAEEEVAEVDAEAEAVEELEEAGAGSCLVCLPLIHVWEVLAACLALLLSV